MFKVQNIPENNFFSRIELVRKKFLKNSGFKEHRKEKVNSISLLHVFEHVSNPIKYLNSLKKILLPNGFIFIETPDYSEINKNNCDPFQFEHLSYFSLLSFVKIARKTGLIIETIERDQTQNYSTSPGRVIRLVLKKTTNLKNNSWNLLANSNLERLEKLKI